MQIYEATIQNVITGLNDRKLLVTQLTFKSQHGSCVWSFVLTNSTDIERLTKLMAYTQANEPEQLNGANIRVIIYGCFFQGFGHPKEDKFVPASGKFEELTEAQFSQKLLKNAP